MKIIKLSILFALFFASVVIAAPNITGHSKARFGWTEAQVLASFNTSDITKKDNTMTIKKPDISGFEFVYVLMTDGVVGKVALVSDDLVSNTQLLVAWRSYLEILTTNYGEPDTHSERMSYPYTSGVEEFLKYGSTALSQGNCTYLAIWTGEKGSMMLQMKPKWLNIVYESKAWSDAAEAKTAATNSGF